MHQEPDLFKTAWLYECATMSWHRAAVPDSNAQKQDVWPKIPMNGSCQKAIVVNLAGLRRSDRQTETVSAKCQKVLPSYVLGYFMCLMALPLSQLQ